MYSTLRYYVASDEGWYCVMDLMNLMANLDMIVDFNFVSQKVLEVRFYEHKDNYGLT